MTSISAGSPVSRAYLYRQNSISPRFGRDAIFDRNKRFEQPAKSEKITERLLSPFKQAFCVFFKEKKRLTAGEDKPLYNAQGRVRSAAVLKEALAQAWAEYNLAKQDKSDSIKQGLAGIKLANAELASNTHNREAFELLKKSFEQLKKAGFEPDVEKAPPVYIHGLYNRGCYVLNNDLHERTIEDIGPEEMAYNEAMFEGMAISPPMDQQSRRALMQGLLEGLPYLEKAIQLSAGIRDHRIAQVEYLSAKGEVLHALSHLTYERNKRKEFEQQGLDTFQKALKNLESVEPQHYTPQHLKLAEKISSIKIPHMCSHQHRPSQAQSLCKQLDSRGWTLNNLMKNNPVQPVPDTPLEKLGKSLEPSAGEENPPQGKPINPYDALVQELLFPERGTPRVNH
jgi:hypothetical protein